MSFGPFNQHWDDGLSTQVASATPGVGSLYAPGTAQTASAGAGLAWRGWDASASERLPGAGAGRRGPPTDAPPYGPTGAFYTLEDPPLEDRFNRGESGDADRLMGPSLMHYRGGLLRDRQAELVTYTGRAVPSSSTRAALTVRSVSAVAPAREPARNAVVYFCDTEYGPRDYWPLVCSDEVLLDLAEKVMQRALQELPEYFGLQMDPSVRFSWQGSYVLATLINALRRLGLTYHVEARQTAPTRAQLEDWKEQLVAEAAINYKSQLVPYMRWLQQMTFGPFNPVSVPRPRRMDPPARDTGAKIGYMLNTPNTYSSVQLPGAPYAGYPLR